MKSLPFRKSVCAATELQLLSNSIWGLVRQSPTNSNTGWNRYRQADAKARHDLPMVQGVTETLAIHLLRKQTNKRLSPLQLIRNSSFNPIWQFSRGNTKRH